MKTYIYDIECYPNYFCVTFLDYAKYKAIRQSYVDAITFEDKQTVLLSIPCYTFEIYNDKSDIIPLLSFLQQDSFFLSGYNNDKYDDMLLNYIQMYVYSFKSIKDTTNKLYEFSNKIITTEFWMDELLKEIHYYGANYRSIDLMKVLHFDKIENRRSLKQVAININWYWIQELPIKPGTILTLEQTSTLLVYNKNDVHITTELFYQLRDDIKLRYEIEIKYQVRVLSLSDSAMGDKLFFKMYQDLTGITYGEFKQGKTYRSWINMDNCINTNISFIDSNLNNMLYQLRKRNIQKTKGELDIKVKIGETTYQIATGGLHSLDKPAVYRSSNDLELIDADVTSFYLYEILNDNICPEHINKEAFLIIIRELVEGRVKLKRAGDKVGAAALKTTALSIFGKFGFEYGNLFDLLSLVQVTMNGQLKLLMLIEVLYINKFKVISANTDGFVTVVPKSRIEEYYNICDKWMKKVNFNLEYTKYKVYIRNNVNHYIAIKIDNECKRKGLLDKLRHIEGYPKLSKSLSMPIVPEAIEEYFKQGVSPRTTITNCIDIYKFCKSQKIGKAFSNELHYIDSKGNYAIDDLQNTIRFYISNKGGVIMKLDSKTRFDQDSKELITINDRTNICAGHNITVFNKWIYYSDFKDYDVNYQYYINEANKIINAIEAGSTNKRIIKHNLGQTKLKGFDI